MTARCAPLALLVTMILALGCPLDPAPDDPVPSDDDDGGDEGLPPPQGCFVIAPYFGEIAVLDVDMATGTWVEAGRFGEWIPLTYGVDAFVLLDQQLVAIGYASPTYRFLSLNLTDDSVEWGDDGEWYRGALATDGTDLITDCDDHEEGFDQAICRFETFEDLVAENPSEILEMDSRIDHMTISGSLLYVNFHNSSNEFDIYDLATGEHQYLLQLKSWWEPMSGSSVSDGVLHLMNHHHDDGVHLSSFDVVTGDPVHESFLDLTDYAYSRKPSGLWCDKGGS